MDAMASKKYLTPQYDFEATEYKLDCRDAKKELGIDLFNLINASISRDQKWAAHDLPCFLILTQRQFASLNNYTSDMYGVVGRLFKSYNPEGKVQCVMEVIIDREVDNYEEVEDTMKLVDEINRDSRAEVNTEPTAVRYLPQSGIIPMEK